MTYGGTGQVVITQDYEHEDPQNCSTNLMKPLIKVVFSISKPTPLTYWVGSGAAMSSSWTDALPTYRKLCKRYLSRSRGGYSTWSRSRWPPHARTHGHAALSLRANSTELSCQRSAVRVHWGHAPVPSGPGPTAVIDKRTLVEETRINHV